MTEKASTSPVIDELLTSDVRLIIRKNMSTPIWTSTLNDVWNSIGRFALSGIRKELN